MTIRERITELTANVKTVVELDAVVSQGVLKTLRDEFQNADAAEIMYEWDLMKMRIRRMV